MFTQSKKDGKAVILSLVAAMIAGRMVWGVVTWVLYGIMGNVLTIQIFMAEAFINAIPGIILQLVAVPLLVAALKKTGTIK